MAASIKLKAAGLLAVSGIIAIGAFYQPVYSPGDSYAATVKLAAGVSAIAGSMLLSSSIGRTFLKNAGRGAFKALYLASFSSAGAGVVEAASATVPMNVAAALCAVSVAFAIAGVWTVYFFKASGA
jgi:hypothetical protein